MGPRRAELLEYKRGGRSASEWLEYIYDAPFVGEEGEESDWEGEVDYPDDPDESSGEDERSDQHEGSEHYELSDTNELSSHDIPPSPSSLSPSRISSMSKEQAKTKEQSDTDLAFEVAYDHQRRRIGPERTLPVPDGRGDTGAAETESWRSNTTSSTAERARRGPAPVPAPAGPGKGASGEGAEWTQSEVEQLRRNLLGRSLSDLDARGDGDAEVESLESAVASSMIEHSGSNSASVPEHNSAGDQGSGEEAKNIELGIEQPTPIVPGPSLPIRNARVAAAAAEAESLESVVASSMIEHSGGKFASGLEHATAGNRRSKDTAESARSEMQRHSLVERPKTEEDLPISKTSKASATIHGIALMDAIRSSIAELPQLGPAPLNAGDQQSEEVLEKVDIKVQLQSDVTTERVRSEIQRRSVCGRLKTKEDLDHALSTMDSEASRLESRIAAMLPSGGATVSKTPTWDSLCIPSMTKEIEIIRRCTEKIRRKKGNGPVPALSPEATCPARFVIDSYVEQVLPCAKRTRFALRSSWRWMARPYDVSEQTVVTLRYPGKFKRRREVVRGIWEHAQTVNLGQPTQQPNTSLPGKQWPKPAQQPIEPPPWQSFLKSMKRPMQNSGEDPTKQTDPSADKEHEQQSFQQAVQQIARLTVKDTVTESGGKPVQQSVYAPLNESVKDVVQQSTEAPIQTPEQSSSKDKLAKLLRLPDQSPAGEPVSTPDNSSSKAKSANLSATPDKPPVKEPLKNLTSKLLLAEKSEQEQSEQPTKKPSPKSPLRKNPAQRRVERSQRLTEKSGEEATAPSSEAATPSQQVPGGSLAVSAIIVVCDFEPTTPDVSPLPPPEQVSPGPAPELETISTTMDSESPTPPASETAITTALRFLDLVEVADPCPRSGTLTETSKPDSSP